jgi:hypothetical protein
LDRRSGEEIGDPGRDHLRVIGSAVIASREEISGLIESGIEGTRQAVAGGIGAEGQSIFPDLVRFEEGSEPVIVGLCDRVILVVVTTGTGDRQAQECLGRVLDVIVEPPDAAELVPIPGEESRRTERGIVVGSGLVGGQHQDDHPVIAEVAVQGLDDPVPPMPDERATLADLGGEPVPVAVAPDVHPVPAPPFAVLRAGEQTIDGLLISVLGGVGEEGSQRLARRDQPGQVERDAAKEFRLVCPRSRRQADPTMLRAQEGVDRIHARGRTGNARPDRWSKRPVVARVARGLLAPRGLCARLDPGSNRGDLLRIERLALRRHARRRLGRNDAFDQEAVIHAFWFDGGAVVAALEDGGGAIQPQPGLLLQYPMARDATPRQDRLDLSRINVRIIRHDGERGQDCQRGQTHHDTDGVMGRSRGGRIVRFKPVPLKRRFLFPAMFLRFDRASSSIDHRSLESLANLIS